jgi:chromosome segregation ATPase
MAESVEIILDGVDNASPAFTAVAGQMKKTADTGQKLSGVFGKIFESLGLSELQAYSGEFSNISGQMKELGDAGEKGGAGMMIAKAGIAAAVAAASFNISKMIGDWVWETEKWKQALKDALDEANKGEQQVREKLDKQFQLRLQIAQAASDPQQKDDELKAMEEKAKFARDNQRSLLKNAEAMQAELENSIWAGLNEGEIEAAKAKTAEEKKKLEFFEQQLETLNEIRNPSAEQQMLDARLKSNEEAKKAAAEALAAEQRQFQEWSKNWDDQKKAQEDLRKKEDDYLAALQIRNEELMNGKRAADEMKASMAGISEEVILQGRELSIQNELLEAQKQLADEQKKKDEERQKAFAQPTAPLQAMQSRLLSRVSTGGGDRVAKATEKTAELTAEIERLQREQLDLQKRRGVTELAIVEG